MQLPPVELLCLPCAGASATMYARWRRLLPASVRAVPVELPGRGARWAEPCIKEFDALVARLCDEHAARRPARYALFGHSMGGLLAFGMAQRLRLLGQPAPCALFVSASPAPTQCAPYRLAGREDDAALVADLRRQGGTPDAVFADAELLQMTLRTLRADYRVCTSFACQPAPPLQMPVHAFGGRDDGLGATCLQAWYRETDGLFTLHWFDGGHFFIRQQETPVLQTIVRALAHCAAGAGRATAAFA